MIKHLALAAVAVGLMASPSTASIVIDDFVEATTVGDGNGLMDSVTVDLNDVVRTVSVTRDDTNTTGMVIGGGLFEGALDHGEVATIEWNLENATINRGFFVNQVLALGFQANDTLGATANYDIELAVASAGATTGTGGLFGVTSVAAFNMLDVVSNGPGDGAGHLAAFADVDTITITITSNSTGGFGFTQYSLQSNIAAVPEPTSIALLGLTGIGGVIAVRRRRKSVSNS